MSVNTVNQKITERLSLNGKEINSQIMDRIDGKSPVHFQGSPGHLAFRSRDSPHIAKSFMPSVPLGSFGLIPEDYPIRRCPVVIRP